MSEQEPKLNQDDQNFDPEVAMKVEAYAKEAAARMAADTSGKIEAAAKSAAKERAPKKMGRLRRALLATTLAGAGVALLPTVAGAAEKAPEPDKTEQTTDVKIVSQEEAIKLKEKRDKVEQQIQKYKEIDSKIENKLLTEGSELTCFFGTVRILDAKQSPILVGPDKNAPESLISIGMKKGMINEVTFENAIRVTRDGQHFLGVQVPEEVYETPMVFVAVPEKEKSLVGGAGMLWEPSNYIKYPKESGVKAGYQKCTVESTNTISLGSGRYVTYAEASMPALSAYEGYVSRRSLAGIDFSWNPDVKGLPQRFKPYEINPADLPEATSPPTALPRADTIPTAPPHSSDIPR